MAKYKHVLIIDDDPLTLFVTQRLMKNSDFTEQVTTFTSCSDALLYLENNLMANSSEAIPQIILLDLNMPGLNGWDFMDSFTQMASENTMMPAINIFSATVEKEDEDRAMGYPFVKNFLIKPLLRQHFSIL